MLVVNVGLPFQGLLLQLCLFLKHLLQFLLRDLNHPSHWLHFLNLFFHSPHQMLADKGLRYCFPSTPPCPCPLQDHPLAYFFFFFFLSFKCAIFFLSKKNFWPHHGACRILVLRPGIEPMTPAVEGWSLNHGTAREVLHP